LKFVLEEGNPKMDIRSRLSLVAAALLALSLAACGDDSNPTTPNDTTPPGVTNVTPVDAYHIDITFSEQVTKSSAEDEANYTITETGAVPVAPRGIATAKGAGFAIVGATLKNDNKTVTLATGTSMSGFNFDVTVHNVSDMTGNKIGEAGATKPFTGSGTPDVTAPSVVSHTPLSDATNIVINATVVVTFSEAIKTATAQWVPGSPLTNARKAALGVGVGFTSAIDGAKLTLTPDAPLAYNQTYTVIVSGTDAAGNAGGNTSWSFTTTANNDHTPPTVVSTSPANGATYVALDANLSITFSESIDSSRSNVELVPDPGAGVATWSNGGKTVTFNPNASLLTNQQYTLTIFPNGVYDWAGNGIVGLHTVTFTTGATLAAGSIAGTVTGDAGSAAADPTGATVIASNSNPFVGGSFSVFNSTKVAGNDTYSMPNLPDGLYYIVSVLDTNHDNDLDPSTGDAVGAFGVNISLGDTNPDSLAIEGGTHLTGKNFTLYDPSTASGTVQYTGAINGDYPVFVGLFDTNGFTVTSQPVVGTQASGIDHVWEFNTIEGTFQEGNYYLGAFMDVSGDGNYQPATEPAGFYGGLPAPTALNMANGHDNLGLVIHITDPVVTASAPAPAMIWPKAKHNVGFQHLVEFIRQSQQQASR
jgi:methionine-rich copper-binding protein CopC